MKTTIHLLSIIMLFTAGMFINTGCSDDETEEITPPETSLTEEEKSDLLVLREEEKLARDVYLYAYDKHQLRISKNISKSEQTHMDEILKLLDKYGIADPASTEDGVFNNNELQKLYNELTAKADSSVIDALIVGTIVEDLDIRDIQDCIKRTNKEDIIAAYSKLECGSRNHLRSYYMNLQNEGGDYTPQFISQEYFDEIVNSDKESCNN